ncbi:MAG TPA: 30S ribosomal protein S16 [Anaerolineae bacterium]|nr:30S ribosomal protein S16 [Anaerolineae bacterium]
MATKIKLSRMGMKKQPTYRVVIQEARSKRDGKYIENIGMYDPRANPPVVQLKADRVNYWLKAGATPTDSVGRLLKMAGITDKYYKQRKKTHASAAAGTEEKPAE